jgi:hypothetical protein
MESHSVKLERMFTRSEEVMETLDDSRKLKLHVGQCVLMFALQMRA